MVELKLPVLMKIYPVVNMSRIVIYQKQVEEQKKNLFPSVKINVSRLKNIDFIFFFILILFFFQFIFHFSIFRTLGLGLEVIGHTITSVTSDGMVTALIIELERREQKVLEQNVIIQHGHHILVSCLTHGHLGQDAQYLAQTIYKSI